jgi:transposase-like protein
MNMEIESDTPGEDSGKPNTGRRITDAEYAQARELYELGQARLAELADKFGITRQTLSKKFKDDSVSFGSRAHEVQAAVSQGIKAAAATSAVQTAAEGVDRYSEKRNEWIEETRVQGYRSLKQADMLAKRIVAEAVKNKAVMASIDDDLKAVQRFQKILVENTLTRLDVLRADEVVDEDDLPQIHFEDLTDEDILAHHKDNGLIADDEDPEAILASIHAAEEESL